jgi:LysR substrate binding domain
MRGVRSERLRVDTLALLVSTRHRLADATSIPLAELAQETLLLFPRELAPAYYDRIMEACERAGFQPRVTAFERPPVLAMVGRLQAGHEVCLAPGSFAFHAAAAEPGMVARKLAEPQISAEWSILWAARAQSASIERFLECARRCADENGWLRQIPAHA